jgi:hypothetical protein
MYRNLLYQGVFEMPVVTLLKNKEDVYIRCDREGGLPVFEDMNQALAQSKADKEEMRRRGHTWEMSLAVSDLTLQRRYLEVGPIEDVLKMVGPKPQVTRLNSVAVKEMGVIILPEYNNVFDTAIVAV